MNTMTQKKLASAWNKSYKQGDNLLFYPNEEVIRFASAYIKKRIGLKKYKTIKKVRRILDLGCGIGRHVWFFDDLGIETYGVDLSSYAIAIAKKMAYLLKKENLTKRLICMSSTKLDMPDAFFDAVITHGTLDSMSFVTAQESMHEIDRVLTTEGYLYADFISGDDSRHAREFDGETISTNMHERGTVQSYFNYTKILKIINTTNLELVYTRLKKEIDVTTGNVDSRWHCVFIKRNQTNNMPR